ncbi:MAG TPA: flagellar hook protein FlgE [Noviherbaspirillum sp.]|uniref:flagellar hook protein FlgE n=1 Tax=Noviherbaspirillum sp. TaxID=1926288 RepID=UPI002B4821BB|nr:flagellar hook protein FlgE [Noviherbaspirillum sp.]HJV88483.1 flagellar hook protein FlgE [Noviherbaspirillum sp.]
MSFQQGLSGLNGASKQLETIGNNIANANTVGFKAATTEFADVYANSLSGTSGLGTAGIGTRVSTIAQQFSQGNVTASNNALDMAINGGGFFRLTNGGAVSYARNGQFQLDKNGYIVSPSGGHLTGYGVDSKGKVATGSPTDLQITTADLPPKQTTEIDGQLNLDARVTPIDPTVTPFNASDPTTYHNGTSATVYDTQGNPHVVQTYYVKTAADKWDVYADCATAQSVNPPVPPATTPPAGFVASVTFDFSGQIKTVAPSPSPITLTLPATNGATSPFSFNLNLTGSTQFGSTFSVNSLSQDGYASGRLSGFGIGNDGIITGRYTNGKTSTLGQVVLANFRNPNGLQPLGNNQWAETAGSGEALVGTPDSGSLGLIQSSATEDSNVDMTAELVNMITAQRVFQANAQTIKTQDQILQTLVNLR